MFGPVVSQCMDYLSGLISLLTEDFMINVSSSGVKLQEVLSGLEKKKPTLKIQVHFCGFSQHSFFSFLLGVY